MCTHVHTHYSNITQYVCTHTYYNTHNPGSIQDPVIFTASGSQTAPLRLSSFVYNQISSCLVCLCGCICPYLCCLCVRWGLKIVLRVVVWTWMCRLKALCLCGACCWDRNLGIGRHVEGKSNTNSRCCATLDLFGHLTCVCGGDFISTMDLSCVQFCMFNVRTSINSFFDWVNGHDNKFAMHRSGGSYETWFCSPATVRHRASCANVRIGRRKPPSTRTRWAQASSER